MQSTSPVISNHFVQNVRLPEWNLILLYIQWGRCEKMKKKINGLETSLF